MKTKNLISSSVIALTLLGITPPLFVGANSLKPETTKNYSVALDSTASTSIEDNSIAGGWSEDEGLYINLDFSGALARSSTVKHTGKAETKTINGTGHKRAHGWTTWQGVKHYTTAQLEINNLFQKKTINGTSGRKWGYSGTEAVSPWKPYSKFGDPGQARTYYGK